MTQSQTIVHLYTFIKKPKQSQPSSFSQDSYKTILPSFAFLILPALSGARNIRRYPKEKLSHYKYPFTQEKTNRSQSPKFQNSVLRNKLKNFLKSLDSLPAIPPLQHQQQERPVDPKKRLQNCKNYLYTL